VAANFQFSLFMSASCVLLRLLRRRASSASAGSAQRVQRLVHDAADLLPGQAILENFVHHNPLSHFEHLAFRDAVDATRRLEAYRSPGARALALTHVDPRKRVNEALVDLAAVFLDRGAAKWTPPDRERGFLHFFASLEPLGAAPWRRHARHAASGLFEQLRHAPSHSVLELAGSLAAAVVEDNLRFFGVPSGEWTDATRAMMLELRGWAGMFHRMEQHPSEAPHDAAVRLVEFCAVQSILTRSSLAAVAAESGWSEASEPFADWLARASSLEAGAGAGDEQQRHPSAIAHVDQSSERRELLELQMQRSLLRAIGTQQPAVREARPALQLYSCIDDRECSFRRHVEQVDPAAVETFGVAGFFGVPIRYAPLDGRDPVLLAPEGAIPAATLIEQEADHEQTLLFTERRRLLASATLAWEKASFSPLGSLALAWAFPVSLARLQLMSFAPDRYRAAAERLQRAVVPPPPPTDFQRPLAPAQAAALLARTLKVVGGDRCFAPIVVVLGHGASSVNNPFAAAYNCGACGGREGGPNARLLARLANDAAVRQCLATAHGVHIPSDTVFVGAVHNTTAELVEFFDVDRLPPAHAAAFARAQAIIEEARGRNALERTHRFLLAADVHTPLEALLHVQTRAGNAAEARPELNHANNAAVVVGRRALTRGRFLDRRVFLPSYDPLADDDAGTNLELVIAPALIVCSGINLEYLFSTIDVEHHGAGSKAPLNIVGNVGVLQGTAGDLRTGLPTQMTEMHTPVRALFVVDAPVARIEAVLSRRRDLQQLVRNGWVRLVARDPGTGQFFLQQAGAYTPVEPDGAGGEAFASFAPQRVHGSAIARRENAIHAAAMLGMVLSCAVPVLLYGGASMHPHGALVAVSATLLATPVLAFARRYLHGEFMFGRFSVLCVGLALSFNLVALAPSLEHALAGWSLFGFASTFLIGAYNDRPTVRSNATYAFAAYQISDFALLVAAACSAPHAVGAHSHPHIVAAGLLVAALLKSSQFPLTSLFVRSMEGPTPSSALGYAGLSAHVGVVLLTATMPLWFGFGWARATVAGVGLFTAVYSTLIAKIRADRKGAIANATAATLGLIYVTLAAGYPGAALLMSLGHAAFRIMQILRAPNVIADSQQLRVALGRHALPHTPPHQLYRLAWALRRFHSDFHLLHVLTRLTRPFAAPLRRRVFTRAQQWILTAAVVLVAGLPFTPLTHWKEQWLTELLADAPLLAVAVEVAHFVLAVVLMRLLFAHVLSPSRFGKKVTR
jgi:uncharacterized protein YbcC (UPF0753/DUF2309 family)